MDWARCMREPSAAEAGAGEEDDFVAAAVEAFAGKQGVFLGAADDEAGDDVEDFHGRVTG